MRTRSAHGRRWQASGAVIAGLLAGAAPAAVHAQGFAGAPAVQSGGATFSGSGSTQTITLGASTQQTIINWAPTDTATSASPINFLAAGQTVNFNAPGVTFNTYSVLNRILPADTTRAIGLNGVINSTSNARVWFYSPSGFLIGSTATFNLGGLVLTASDPVLTTDPLTGQSSFITSSGGTDRFTVNGVDQSKSAITIQSGAKINVAGVSGSSTYMVAIAPQINNGGTINVTGSTALVAAESASFSVDPTGLFSISVTPTTVISGPSTEGGTTVGAGALTNTGSVVSGDSVANGATEVRRIYMVAIPKNNALTMAISSGGTLGFATAGAAAMNGNEIVLSAGENVNDTGSGNPTNGTNAGTSGISANLTIGAGKYTSNLYGVSTGSVTVTDPALSFGFSSNLTLAAPQATINAAIGTVNVAGNLSLIADNTGLPAIALGVPNSANVTVASGAKLNVGSNSGVLGVNGDLLLSANDALAGQGGLTQIAVTGGALNVKNLTKLSATGSWANAPGANTGGVATNGGTAIVTASAGGTITTPRALTLDVNADGSNAGTNYAANGGSASVTVTGTGSQIATQGIVTATADAQAGIYPGGAYGGTVNFAANSGGVLSIGATGQIVGSASATGGAGGASNGGDATGGSINLIANDGSVAMQGPAVIRLAASATGGASDTAAGGVARGGSVQIQTQGATGSIVGNLAAGSTGATGASIDVSATGGSVTTNGAGGAASGGLAFIGISGVGQSIALDAIPSLTISAGATGGAGLYNSGGAATGGKVQLGMNAGSFETSATTILFASAAGGSSYSSSGGNAVGGNVLVYPGQGGSLAIQTGTTFSAAAFGGSDSNGNGGNALGGNVLIDAINPSVLGFNVSSGGVAFDTSFTAGTGFLPSNVGTAASAGGSRLRTTGSLTVGGAWALVGNTSLSIQTGGDLGVTGTIAGSGAGAYLQLWADNTGTGTGTVTLASNAINLSGTGAAVDIDYNPTALGTPTNYAPGVAAGLLTAYQLVDDVNQLQLVGTYPTQNFALGKNIDASASQGWNSGAGFVPIGNGSTPFSGNFDGLGHTVSNLFINLPITDDVGLFGAAGGAVIRNVGLIDPQISGSNFVGGLMGATPSGATAISNSYVTEGTISGLQYVGGLLGSANAVGTTLNHVHSDAAVLVTGGAGHAGGLVGTVAADGIAITDAFSTGSVTATASGSFAIGGLVGYMSGHTTLGQAYSTAAVMAAAGSNSIGGLIGSIGDAGPIITNTYATGAITSGIGSGNIGGLVGFNSGTISNSWSSGAVSAPSSTNVGGFVGINTFNSGFGGTIVNSYWDTFSTGQAGGIGTDAGTTTLLKFVSSGTADILAGAPSAFQAGSYTNLTSGNWVYDANVTRPIGAWEIPVAQYLVAPVSSAHQVQLIDKNGVGTYLVTQNIDMSGTAQLSDIWGGKGIIPITLELPAGAPEGASTVFNGWIQGSGHVLSNLTINGNIFSQSGLFSTNSGLIYDLGLWNATLSSSAGTTTTAGLLVGQNYVGGTIYDSFATGTLSVFDAVAGGLVGNNAGSINQAYASVNNTTGMLSGGLVGVNTGTISTAYANGAVSGGQAGGLIGSNASTVGTITNAYWDNQLSGQSIGCGISSSDCTGVTGLTTAQTLQSANFTGFAIDTAGGLGQPWRIYDGSSTPLLKAFLTPITVQPGSLTQVYNAVAPSVGYTTYGASNTLLFGSGTLSAINANAGTQNVTYTGGLYSNQIGYDLVASSTPGVVVITPAPLTLTAAADTRVYNGTINSTGVVGISGLQGTDSVGNLSQSFDSANVGSRVLSVNAGYVITDGNSGGNYTVTLQSTAGAITAAPLTVTGNTSSTTYNGASQSNSYKITAGILFGSDAITSVSGLASGTNVGTYLDTLSSAAGTGLSNYSITYVNGSLAIGKATLTLKGANNSIGYNGVAHTNFGASLLGTQGSDSFTIGGYASGTNAGTYTDALGLTANSGTLLSNYNLTVTEGGLTINKAALTLTGNTTSTTYNAAAHTNGYTITAGQLFGSDSITSVSGLATGTNAGTYLDTLSSAIGTGLANYTIGYVNGSLVIGKAALTLTGANNSTTYNGVAHTNSGASLLGTQGSDGFTINGYASGTSAGTYTDALGLTANSGTLLSNYNLTVTEGGLSINKAALTLTGNTTSTTYNASAQTNGYTITAGQLFGSDSITSVSGLAAGTNAGTYIDTLSGAIGTGLANYTIGYVNGSLAIGKAALTLTGANNSTTYNGVAHTNSGASLLGTQGSDGFTISGYASGTNAGSYTDALGLTANSGTLLSNYNLTVTQGGLTINKAALTLTGDTTSTTYNAAAQTNGYKITAGQLFGSDSIASVSGLASGTNAGTYLDTLSGATGTGLANYTIGYVNGSLAIGKAALTVTGSFGTATYNATTQSNLGATLAGAQGADSFTISGFGTGVNVGTYADALAVSANSGTLLSNYSVTINEGALTINKAALTITGDTTSTTYNAAAHTNGYTITAGQLFGSDSITSLSGLATGTNAGTYLDTLSGATGTGLSNYTIGYVNGSLAIGKAALTLTGANNSTTYNGVAHTNSGASLLGTQGSDGFTISGYASGTNAGSYTDALGLTANSGTLLSNYNLTVTEGGLTITKAALTLTGNTTSTTYNAAAHTNGYTITAGQLFSSDSITSVSGLASGTNAGTYLDTLSGAIGTGLANYTIGYVNGSLAIGKAALTLTGANNSTTYNSVAHTNSGASLLGTQGSDSFTISGYASGTNAGTYTDALGLTANSGTLLSNYNLTVTEGGLTINKAPLTVTGSFSSTTYNGTAQGNSGATLLGAQGSDSFVISGFASGTNAGTYADALGVTANSGTLLSNYNVTINEGALTINKAALTLTGNTTNVTYNGGIQTNGYAITTGQLFSNDSIASVSGLATGTNAGTYVDALSGVTGTGLANYAVSYVNGNLTIGKAALTLDAVSQTRTYDSTTGSSGMVRIGGLQGHDSIAALSQSYDSANAGSRTLSVNAGYVISDGNNGGNYTITLQSAAGTITPAPLTVVYNANAASSVYGDAIPALAGTISVQGLQGNDATSAVLGGTAQFATTATAQSNVGQYAVNGSGLSLSTANYTANFVQQSGNATALSITARPIDVTAQLVSRPFNQANPTLTYTVTGPNGAAGLVNGDQLTGALATSATILSPSGAYPITQGSLAASSNYKLTYFASDLVVKVSLTPVNVVITSVDTSLPGSSGGDGGGGGNGGGDSSKRRRQARDAVIAAMRGAMLPSWVPSKVFDDSLLGKPRPIDEPVSIKGDSSLWTGTTLP